MTTPPGFGRWFLPGPAEVHPDILAAMNRPMIAHRGSAMEQLMAELRQPLAELFRTAHPVVIGTASTTGFMEAAIRCGVVERVLVVVGGAFGERFAQIAEGSGKEVVRVMIPPGRTLEPEYLAQFLDGPPVDAIALVHSETSTGALAPLPDLISVVRNRKELMVLVDAASSLGGSPVETDQWGIDFVFTGSQKALGLPPGLALGAVSPRLLERSRRLENRGRYFDLVRYVEAAGRNQPPSTPSIPLYFALAAQMERIRAVGGIEARWSRHLAMLAMVEAWTLLHPQVNLLAADGRRSWTVSCLQLPGSISGDQVVRAMAERGWVIGAGYGELKPNTIRIGHMGDAEPGRLGALLEDLGKVLRTKD